MGGTRRHSILFKVRPLQVINNGVPPWLFYKGFGACRTDITHVVNGLNLFKKYDYYKLLITVHLYM